NLLEVDSPNGANGPEPVLFVVPAAGTYRIEVVSLEPGAAPGRYLVTLRTKGPAPAAMAPKRVGAGAAVEGRIVGIAVDLYEVELQEGQVLDAVVEQNHADVVVRLRAPGGSLVEKVDSPNGTNGPEPLWY